MERADYWAMTQLTTHWSLPGDARDHFLVEATTDAPLLSVFANARPDGKADLVVVNKDPENDVQTDLRMRGFRAAGKGRCFTFDKTNYQWKTDQPPYHAEPSKAPTETPSRSKALHPHLPREFHHGEGFLAERVQIRRDPHGVGPHPGRQPFYSDPTRE
jgi:hypothetical protein